MKRTGFSIIMPTYNQAAFIRRAIVSLQRQTYSEWELIIVNDGSTDNTELFLSDYLQSPKIIYIHNEESILLIYLRMIIMMIHIWRH